MKMIRVLILLLAGGVLAICGSYAQGQAEIDPDHFEPTVQVATADKTVSSTKSSKHQENRLTASRHTGKERHHPAHTAA